MTSLRTRRRQAGNSLLEFTLIGIPLLFVLISIFEISRGMWVYHTLAYAIKEGTRYAAVHGENCVAYPNSCGVTVKDVAARIQRAGVGLIPDQFDDVTLQAGAAVITCATLTDCLAKEDTWPASPNNGVGLDITISAHYPFTSAIAMFWPGAGSTGVFPTFHLGATSTERIEF